MLTITIRECNELQCAEVLESLAALLRRNSGFAAIGLVGGGGRPLYHLERRCGTAEYAAEIVSKELQGA